GFYYEWGHATSANVTGLPNGISAVVNNTAKTVAFSGAPTEAGVFRFTVSTIGGNPNASHSGTITAMASTPPPVVTGDILGPDCGHINSTITFELNASNRQGASAYSWYVNGYSKSITPQSASPYIVKIETGEYFTNAEICVGVNYSASPWYATYCKQVATCASVAKSAGAEIQSTASIGPNPSQDNFKLSVNEDVESVTVTNTFGTIVYTYGKISSGSEIQYGSNFATGMYAVTIIYASGRVEMQKIQKL
ncbi:MAG: T9SS type A sorting domain-containing protein, partial [Cytophagaceae bacterium]